MKQINNKKQWYKLFNSGIFNRTENYTIKEFLKLKKAKVDGKRFMLRNTKVAGGLNYVDRPHLVAQFILFSGKIKNYSDFIVSVIAPDESIVVQGNYDGINIEVSFEKQNIRAIDLNKRITKIQLKELIGEENYNVLNEWLEIYHGHIIEFSFYSKPVGVHKHPLIIWEIRNY